MKAVKLSSYLEMRLEICHPVKIKSKDYCEKYPGYNKYHLFCSAQICLLSACKAYVICAFIFFLFLICQKTFNTSFIVLLILHIIFDVIKPIFYLEGGSTSVTHNQDGKHVF